jgi:hypothetical protein
MHDWTMSDARACAATLIRSGHDQLAAFARAHYQADGRGAAIVTVRGPRPARVPELRELKVGYRTVQSYSELTAPYTEGSIRMLADEVLGTLATYDPHTTFVVLVVMGPEFLTIPATVQLAPLPVPVPADAIH